MQKLDMIIVTHIGLVSCLSFAMSIKLCFDPLFVSVCKTSNSFLNIKVMNINFANNSHLTNASVWSNFTSTSSLGSNDGSLDALEYKFITIWIIFKKLGHGTYLPHRPHAEINRSLTFSKWCLYFSTNAAALTGLDGLATGPKNRSKRMGPLAFKCLIFCFALL